MKEYLSITNSVNIDTAESMKLAFEKRTFTLGKHLGEITDDLIIQAQHIYPTRMQVTDIFEVQNY